MGDLDQSELLRLQRMEATESLIYRQFAAKHKDEGCKKILEELSVEEKRHEKTLSEITGKQVKPYRFMVIYHVFLSRLFGLTFAIRLMERAEQDISAAYRRLGLDDLAAEEDSHEERLSGMLSEQRLEHTGCLLYTSPSPRDRG